VADRLDEERLEILRSWGAGLASDAREELRAAGKAITVLIEEIDHLQVDLWSARVEQHTPGPAPEPVVASTPGTVTAQGTALRERLTRTPRTT
jgi:hypothetical protein